MKLQQWIVAGCALLFGVSLIEPVYPREQWLQHAPTVVALPGLFYVASRGWLSTCSMARLCAFLALHIVGARWIYSFVPYDDWTTTVVGSGPSQWFNLERNHYDRFVHFAFGVLFTAAVAEIAQRYARLSPILSLATGVGFVLSAGAVYEIFEWALAMVAAPQFADRYNGQQGDMWDAQKDMALALAGSLLAVVGIHVVRRLAAKSRGGLRDAASP